jgi:V/A-type H+-transporting ATPase subunit D
VTTPSRSAVLELKDERRAMREGHAFLDEKCLLLAGEMLRGLERYESLRAAFDAARREALAALDAAIARHGLDGLQVYPRADGRAATLRATPRSVMGVRLLDAELATAPSAAPAPVDPSPEAEACRRAHARLAALAVPLAASAGNLERLRLEYRRAMRRARALQDVLIPEIAASLNAMETRLEELEQEEAVVMRRAAVAE